MTEGEIEKLKTPLREVICQNGLFKELLPFDEYHLIMAQSDVLEGMQDVPAVKTYFYRVPPFGSSYIISAGLSSFLNKVSSFDYRDIVPYLEEKGYDKKFVEYAKTRGKLRVAIHALPENSPAFPNEPIMVLKTNLVDARLLEGIVLSEMNFAGLCATKWHRIVNAASCRPIMEFGRRRAQNGLKASLYSYMAGAGSTSNCEANNIFGIPSSGTMGHEYVQSFASEPEAFDKWLEYNPSRPCLLLDTLSVMESGLPNAAGAFKKHKERLISLGFWNKIAFRIDSGDLAYLGMACYNRLAKELETEDIAVVLSNDLDEYSLSSIFSQITGAGGGGIIKHLAFGIGTKGVTAWGEPALGGVCKLSMLGSDYVVKISNNTDKITLPGNLRSAVIKDKDGQYVTTLIYFYDEPVNKIEKFIHPFDDTKFIYAVAAGEIQPRQRLVYTSDGLVSAFVGKYPSRCLEDIRGDSAAILESLDWSYKRIFNPHTAKVSLSPRLFEVRRDMVRGRLISFPSGK